LIRELPDIINGIIDHFDQWLHIISFDIAAKLQGKVGKFGLIQDTQVAQEEAKRSIADDALAVLIQLQYKKSEAKAMIQKALEEAPGLTTSEELLNEIYKQKQK